MPKALVFPSRRGHGYVTRDWGLRLSLSALSKVNLTRVSKLADDFSRISFVEGAGVAPLAPTRQKARIIERISRIRPRILRFLLEKHRNSSCDPSTSAINE